MSSFSTSSKQLYAFHAQDRAIFSKLVLTFSRPLAESLLVMATWFWLEDFGFEEIFSIIMALNDPLVAALADEAVLCFRCLDSNEPPNDSSRIPLTVGLMKKDISLQLIYENRYSAIVGIKNFLNTVCSRIFTDIIQQVFPSYMSLSDLFVPDFLHPTFGDINMITNGIWGWNASCMATRNDRTLFLTFSRGVPVSEEEIMILFTEKFGENCVEAIEMPKDNGLYARLVVESVATVDRILKGEHPRKLHIFNKHIWARKYQERLH